MYFQRQRLFGASHPICSQDGISPAELIFKNKSQRRLRILIFECKSKFWLHYLNTVTDEEEQTNSLRSINELKVRLSRPQQLLGRWCCLLNSNANTTLHLLGHGSLMRVSKKKGIIKKRRGVSTRLHNAKTIALEITRVDMR